MSTPDPLDTPDLWDRVNDFIMGLGEHVKTDDDLELFLDLTRGYAWDIPSALGSICGHGIPETNHGDFFMHRNDSWDNDWSPIDLHFKEVHGLDLSSDMINWSFDT